MITDDIKKIIKFSDTQCIIYLHNNPVKKEGKWSAESGLTDFLKSI